MRIFWIGLCLVLAAPQALCAAGGQGTEPGAKPQVAASAPNRRHLKLRSATALVVDRDAGQVLYAKNADKPMPIASITKLMTAMVVLDAGLSPNEFITIADDDKDRLRHSRSRLPVGAVLTRNELLHMALIASENRAAAALARTYPDGHWAFVRDMNRKAGELGMDDTRFVDPTGLDAANKATAQDLLTMLWAAFRYPAIRAITTLPSFTVSSPGKAHDVTVRNTNLLVRKPRENWSIGLSKTGFIQEAGRCLVMQAEVAERSLFIVLLNSWGKYTSIGDSNRIRKWLNSTSS